MGYGKMEQIGHGIHLRQFSRAFVIEDSNTRIAFVSIDSSMMGDHVRIEVSQDSLFSLFLNGFVNRRVNHSNIVDNVVINF